jgi:hypothetical protein
MQSIGSEHDSSRITFTAKRTRVDGGGSGGGDGSMTDISAIHE